VRIYSPHKRFFVTVCALLDHESVFISESLVQRLRVSRINRSVSITSISEMQSVSHAAQITPASRVLYYDRPYTSIINEIFTKSNQYRVQWKYIAGFELADPMSLNPIDIIIGADLFGMLVLDGVQKGSEHKPTATLGLG